MQHVNAFTIQAAMLVSCLLVMLGAWLCGRDRVTTVELEGGDLNRGKRRHPVVGVILIVIGGTIMLAIIAAGAVVVGYFAALVTGFIPWHT